jgi:hypothetical protein
MKKLFIVFAVLCLAAPAMAADWNFYGSARFKTFYIDNDPDVAGSDSIETLLWDQQGNSRIGANVKVNDEISGRFEYGTGPNLRLLYGAYTFGSGYTFQIGQDYTPSSSYFYSNSVFGDDGDLLGVGAFYAGRIPMVQLKLGGLKLALIKQNTTAYAGYTTETMLPKRETSYGYKADNFFVDIFAGYQSYEIKSAAQELDIDSYVAGVGGGVNFGPVYFKAGVHMGQNYGNYGAGTTGLRGNAVIDANQLRDVDNFGFLGVLGFKASDMMTFEVGYGYQEAEVDGGLTDEVQQMYAQAVIGITKGFFVVPEIGVKTFTIPAAGTENEPEEFYLGAKWQINF